MQGLVSPHQAQLIHAGVIIPCTRGQRDFVVFPLMTCLSMGRSAELKLDLPESCLGLPWMRWRGKPAGIRTGQARATLCATIHPASAHRQTLELSWPISELLSRCLLQRVSQTPSSPCPPFPQGLLLSLPCLI